jgi:hypothetical protein
MTRGNKCLETLSVEALVSVESRKCGKDGVGCETRDLGGSAAVNNKESGDEAGLQIWSMRFIV